MFIISVYYEDHNALLILDEFTTKSVMSNGIYFKLTVFVKIINYKERIKLFL